MRILSSLLFSVLSICFINLTIHAQSRVQHTFSYDSTGASSLAYNDAELYPSLARVHNAARPFPAISSLMLKNEKAQVELGYSKAGRAIEAFYFPGKTTRRALVIGGVHGSELSAIELARKLLKKLAGEEEGYYSVIVVPVLFPDNEILALQKPKRTKKEYNIGRYSHSESADPNRQMPPLGKAFKEHLPFDYLGREIELENQLLLQLIREFQPDRILNLHAIRDIRQAGVYADPRTDHQGLALGYQSDSSLVIDMAKYIYENGGNVSGNRFDSIPSALYYHDPTMVEKGVLQPRNLTGSKLPGDRGFGVSLGSWATTAICDSIDTTGNRPALRLVTVEFPGYQKPGQYPELAIQKYYNELTALYVDAIHKFFLGEYYPEDFKTCDCSAGKKESPQLVSERE